MAGRLEREVMQQLEHTFAREAILYAAGPLGAIVGALDIIGPTLIKPLVDKHANVERVIVPQGPMPDLQIETRFGAGAQWAASLNKSSNPMLRTMLREDLDEQAERMISDKGNRVSKDPVDWILWAHLLRAYLVENTRFWREQRARRDRGELPVQVRAGRYPTKGEPKLAHGWELRGEGWPVYKTVALRNKTLLDLLASFGLDAARLDDPSYSHPILEPEVLAGAIATREQARLDHAVLVAQVAPAAPVVAPAPALPAASALALPPPEIAQLVALAPSTNRILEVEEPAMVAGRGFESMSPAAAKSSNGAAVLIPLAAAALALL